MSPSGKLQCAWHTSSPAIPPGCMKPQDLSFSLSPSTQWNLNTTKGKTGILTFPTNTIKKPSPSSSTFELSDTLCDADHWEKHMFTINIIPWDWLREVKSLWQESYKHVTPWSRNPSKFWALSLVLSLQNNFRYNLLKTKIQPFGYGVYFNKPDVRSCWGTVQVWESSYNSE